MIVQRRLVLVMLLLFATLLAVGCNSDMQPTTDAPISTSGDFQETLPLAGTPTPVPTGAKVAWEHIQRLDGATLARVNGEAITWDDYEPVLGQALASLDRQYELKWDDPAMQERLKHLQYDVLDQIVDRRLAGQMAAAQGITVSEAEVKIEFEQEKEAVLSGSPSGSLADWDAFLQASGFTVESFKQFIRDRMLFEALLEAQEVATQTEQLHIRYIPVSDETTAQATLTELRAGRSFEELAAQYSEDPETKDKGGDLGWFSLDMLPSEIKEELLPLSTEDFSGVIKTQNGYMIVQILERALRDIEPEQVYQLQLDVLLAQIQRERNRAQIEYLVDFTVEQNGQ